MREYIQIGTELRFDEGIFTVTEINDAGLVYGDLRTYDEDGEVEQIEHLHLTKSDIAEYLHRYDGMNHDIVIVM